MILVTGATGHVGSELISQLAAAGRPARALVRAGSVASAANDASDASDASDGKRGDGSDRGDGSTAKRNAASSSSSRLPPGVEAVAGDLNRADSLGAALDGVQALFLLSGYADTAGVLAAARQAGVERVVLLSSQSAADSDTSNAVARYHIETEAAVRESGLTWTFLRPSSFMSNALRWLPQMREGDVIREAFGDARIATVDPHDIAAVAMEALFSGEHAGKAYRLTGPESLTAEDRVRILGRVLGRPLRYEVMSDDEARAEMNGSMPPEYIAAFFDFFRGGRYSEATVYPTIQEVTGRPPRTFEQWATAHAPAFRVRESTAGGGA